MANEQDIKNAFNETWKARRELAHAQHELSLAEKMLEIRRGEYEAASEALGRADERLQRLAERVAGVDNMIDDSQEPAPRRNGFRPVLR